MKQIPLDISVATDGTLLPSKNILETARVIARILERKENEWWSSGVTFFLPDADMFWGFNDELSILG